MPRLLLVVLLLAPLATRAQHALAPGGPYDPAIPTPQSVLGYALGDDFTPHHLLMRYLARLDAASPRVRLDTVAHSFEGREVVMAVVTSEGNHARLGAIRADAARLADPRGATDAELAAVAERLPVIVWLGYTVHGPEASGVEAALGLLYQLAAGQDDETARVLDRAVVLVDPLQNPDGHERHAQDVRRMRNAAGGPPVHPAARVHWGTWPGPRTSHYHFDLNRDWFTGSHPETRGRIRAMLAWHPHVAVDLHEMGTDETYFFPPPMAPINALVPANVLRWWDVFAEGNRPAFDRQGWSYFRREGYDEFYPGYGSSWPVYTGAIGMTYEQATSRGGAIRREDGTVLTLREAARHHYAAAWATVTTAAAHADGLVRDYLAFRREALQPADADFRALVFTDDDAGRADSLAKRLAENGVEVGRLREAVEIRDALRYGEERPGRATLPAGAYVVDFAQPQGRLARVLLEPDAPFDTAFVSDELARRRTGQESQIYDVTAWSLPFAFNVRAWGVRGPVGPVEAVAVRAPSAPAPAEARYAYAFPTGTEASLRLLAGLLADSVRAWHAPQPFRAGGHAFPHGAFLVRVGPNGAGVHAAVRRRAAEAGVAVAALHSAGVEEGADLGSGSVAFVRAPRVALLAEEPVYGQSFGYAWYALDQRLRYPTTPIDADEASGSALDDFDVLVVPSASPSGLRRALDGEHVAAWVHRGGVLITLDAATDWLASEDLGLARLRPDTTRADTLAGAPLPASVPGAIVRAEADTLSALTAGLGAAELPVLVFSDRVYAVPEDVRPGEAVVRYAPEGRLRLAGYLWPEVPAKLAGTPYLWAERVGRGRVVAFAGDPNFRDQWRGLLPLFANAVFLSGR